MNFVVENRDGERVWSGYASSEANAWDLFIAAAVKQNPSAPTRKDDLEAQGFKLVLVQHDE